MPRGPGSGRRPDLTLRPSPIPVPGENRDWFALVKLPYELPGPRDVSCIEFVPDPGHAPLFHHVNFEVLSLDPGVDLPAGEAWLEVQAGFSIDGALGRLGLLTAGPPSLPYTEYYGAWAPGYSPRFYTGGVGIRLPSRGVLMVNVLHLGPTPVPVEVGFAVNFYFAGTPVVREIRTLVLGNAGNPLQIEPEFYLPAGRVSTFTARATLHQDLSVLYLAPHMHLRGRTFRADVVDAGGCRVPLIRIPEWDFDWQELYELEPPLRIRPGSVVEIEAVFDNTAQNPRNPVLPPRDLRPGNTMGTDDEMLQLLLLGIPGADRPPARGR